ncbi:hypothetical protein [Mesobacillus sp.]|uniref:hypothetical protein n=1 Tax=Mesobacillus sp. TaxID=2675271 RepID=UPI0039EF805F
MKRLWPIIIMIFATITGLSFLFFVVRMIWFPPNSMGMMMGRQMMYHHMRFWFGQAFWLFLIMLGIGLLLWMVFNRINRKK